MAIKKRCIRCLKVVREDGTCQNPCVKYVPEPEPEPEEETKAESGTNDSIFA